MESELRNRYKNFFALTESYFSPDSVGVVESALTLADEKLSGMMRYDGTPLLDHAVGVAMIVISELGLGRNSTISTILHDVVRLGLLAPSEAGRLFAT